MENTLAVEVTRVQLERWEGQASGLLTSALTIEVVDATSQEVVAAIVREIDGQIKEIKREFREPKDLAHKAHQSICALEAKALGVREEVKRTFKGMIGVYQTEQERQRREERDKRQIAAQKQADEEALRLAEALEADGRTAEAEDAIDNPVPAPIMPAPPAPAKPKGAITRVYWGYEVVDASLIPREYMEPDVTKLGSYARSMKDAAKMPGVRFYSERY